MKLRHYHLIRVSDGEVLGGSGSQPVPIGTEEEYKADAPCLTGPGPARAIASLEQLLLSTVARARSDGKRYMLELSDGDADPFEHGVFSGLCRNLIEASVELEPGFLEANKYDYCLYIGHAPVKRTLH